MEVIIIGTGMYVSGRGTDGFGTILPAVSEFHRRTNLISKLTVVGTDINRTNLTRDKFSKLNYQNKVNFPVEFFPSGNDPHVKYIDILKNNESADCVIVVVPDNLHFEIVENCIKHNKHVLVVKPLTPTILEAKTLIELAKKKNVYGAVEFHKRWDKQNRILLDEFQNGNLGTPLYSWTEYSQRKSIPSDIFKSWVKNNNILQYLGTHYIDIIRFVTKAKPVEVLAVGQKSWLLERGFNVHDSIQCFVKWELDNKILFNQTLLVNWIDPETTSAMSDQNIKFVGTKGRFEGDQKNRGSRIVLDSKQIEDINPDFCKSFQNINGERVWEGYGIESVCNFMTDVLHIKNGKKNPIDFEGCRPTFMESLYSTAVIEKAYKSLQNKSSWEKINL